MKLTAWLLPCLALACHGASHSTLPGRPPPAQVEHTVQAGARVVSLARPTPGLLRLSLYIDAGSRDASPPQAATVAAWLAAEHAGAGTEALVYPDLTELSRTCDPKKFEQCASELARALTLRSPTAAQLLAARARLEDVRRRALAADPARPVDELAARALLDDDALGFFPLGRAEDDPQLTAASVDQLLRAHYGPKRVLLVAAGEIDADELRDVANRVFAKLPAATADRAVREIDLPDRPALQTALDNQGSLSFALIGRHESELRAQVAALTERISSQAESDTHVSGHVFGVRGAALALVRIDGEALDLLPRATRELARLRLEVPPRAAANAGGDDLASLSRALGLGFGTRAERGAPELPAGMSFGAGLLIPADPGAGPRVQGQADQSDAARREQAEAAFARALATDEPRTSGERDDYATSISVDNGARIDVQYAHGPYVAIAVRVALGAEQDSAEMHGRSALLASVTASACAGLGPELLRDELAQLGATLEPRVHAESYGLLLRAPRGQWQAALDLALRCARSPSRDAAHFAAAAVRLQARLSSKGSELGLRARAAGLIAPRAPGMVAPWGDPSRIGSMTARDIAEAFRQSEVGVRWSVALVGPVPVAEATSRIARRLADLPSGVMPKAVEPGQLQPTSFVPPSGPDADTRTLLVTWDARGAYTHRLGATIFASALHAVLSLTPGVEVAWQDADVYPAGAYVALQLRATAEVWPRMPELLREASARLDDATLDEALDRGLVLSAQAHSAADGEASVRAEQLARARVGARITPAVRDQARAAIQVLRRATPRLIVLR